MHVIKYVYIFSEQICDNCSDIIINNITNPSEVELCAGENISIAIITPPIFNISTDYDGISLRFNNSNVDPNRCSSNGDVTVPFIVYHCENMEESDSGFYSGHNLINCGGADTGIEWCTDRVFIKVNNCSNGTNGSPSPTTSVPQALSNSTFFITPTSST